MILGNVFAFIVERSWKTCIFTQKWLDHLLFITSYLDPKQLTTELDSKFARGINEQLLKKSGADVLPSRKN